MRTSFWDIAGTQANFEDEISYIDKSLYHTKFYPDSLNYGRYSLAEYIDSFYFSSWAAKNKITCPTIADLRSRLLIDEAVRSASLKVEDFLLYLEFAVNLVTIVILKNSDQEAKIIAKNIFRNIATNCERLNFEIAKFSEEGPFKLVEKNAAATAVADKYSGTDSEFSYKVIEYNHFLLKGNLGRKREILNAIADKFEAVKQKLKANGFSNIESDAGYLVNNINIRHNNTDPQSNSYKTYIAAMPPAELEEWYDKTYDVLLLALLASDFSELHGDIQELKKKIGAK